jgi:hypothetical protein
MCIGNILREEAKLEGGEELLLKDPLFLRAKADIGEYYFVPLRLVSGEGC